MVPRIYSVLAFSFFFYPMQLYYHFKITYRFKFYFNLQGDQQLMYVEQILRADIMTSNLSNQSSLKTS